MAGAEPCGQRRDEKLHAVVARSTCPSQNGQSASCSEHFWKLRCRKSARSCGAKMCEAHFEVKSAKKLGGSEHFWTFRYRFAWHAQGIVHVVKSEQL